MDSLAFPKTPRKPKPKKKKVPKITVTKVQTEFNAAIRRRDGYCVMTHSPHSGNMESSHFFAVKPNPCLRFYPPNAHTQCTKHHLHEYHHDNPLPYVEFMMGIPELEWMEAVKKRSIKYTQEVLGVIIKLCREDKLDVVKGYIEDLIGN